MTTEHEDTPKDTGPAQDSIREDSEQSRTKEPEGPVHVESEGHAPHDMRQGRRKKPFIRLVYTYLHLAISLVVSAIKTYDRLWVKRRRNHH